MTDMTTTSGGDADSRHHTWVELQRDRIERSAGRGSGGLTPEDGIGAGVGATIGVVVGMLVGVVAIAVSDPSRSGGAVLLVLGAAIVGVCAGALIGALLVGGHARQARSEFDDLRVRALDEPPVQSSAGPSPTVEAGTSVFEPDRRGGGGRGGGGRGGGRRRRRHGGSGPTP